MPGKLYTVTVTYEFHYFSEDGSKPDVDEAYDILKEYADAYSVDVHSVPSMGKDLGWSPKDLVFGPDGDMTLADAIKASSEG